LNTIPETATDPVDPPPGALEPGWQESCW